jgi:radical SAM superfamily enzyme YgiQ (UPF0313 family)
MSSRWTQVEVIRSRLADEQGTLFKQAPLRVALCYPSPYRVGMSSLGFQTLYREIHLHPGATADRAFLPDDVTALRESSAPLLTYETQNPVSQVDLIGLSVAWELELTGVLELLSLAGLPLLSRERTSAHPLVVAGGPLTFSNPAPLEPFVDLLVLGEADQLIHELLDAVQQATSRQRLLDQLDGRAGFHVTGRGRPLPPIAKAPDDRLPARSQIITPHSELRSMFLVEPERGCSRSCAYCVMRRTTNGGMRVVPPEKVLALIPREARRVGLVGAAVTDCPHLAELVHSLVESHREVGLSSLRADRLTPELVELLAQGGLRTLTVASDGASQKVRDSVDRRTTEKDLLRAARLAREARIERLKIYELIGLPGEEGADIDELARLASELSGILPVSLAVSAFVAKRNTPLQGAPFEPMASLEKKLSRLRRKVKGRVEVRPSSTRWAFVEYLLAQSGPEGGLAALQAWKAGGSFSAFRNAFEELEPRLGR